MKKSFLICILSTLLLLFALWKLELIPHGYMISESTKTDLDLKVHKVNEAPLFNHSLEFNGGRETEYKSWFGREYSKLTFFHGFYQSGEYELKSSDTDVLRISRQELIPVSEGNVTIHAITFEGKKDSFLVNIEKNNATLIPEVVK